MLLFSPSSKNILKVMEPWNNDSGEEEHNEQKENFHRAAKGNEGIPMTSVLFIEQTPNGKYARRLRECEEKLAPKTGYRVIFFRGVEPCEAKVEDSKCRKRNILYESVCLLCRRREQEWTACTFGRAVGQLLKEQESAEEHPDETDPKFSLKVVKVFQNALIRQATEAVKNKVEQYTAI